MRRWLLPFALSIAPSVDAQAGFSPPTVQRCPGLQDATNIACVNNYAAVLPYPFKRASASGGGDPGNDTFVDTSVPSDPSFALLEDTPFVVFDEARGLKIVGTDTKLERIFDTRNDSIHEAPVYVPGQNVIIYSLPHQGYVSEGCKPLLVWMMNAATIRSIFCLARLDSSETSPRDLRQVLTFEPF